MKLSVIPACARLLRTQVRQLHESGLWERVGVRRPTGATGPPVGPWAGEGEADAVLEGERALARALTSLAGQRRQWVQRVSPHGSRRRHHPVAAAGATAGASGARELTRPGP